MKRVLVATDLSADADEAIRQGTLWARTLDAKLIVFHVLPAQLPPNVYPVLSGSGQPHALDLVELRARAERAVAARMAALTGLAPDAYVAVIGQGSPHSEIPREAEELGADLVVVGTHGRTRLAGALLGSVATSVIRRAHSAVLVARPSPSSGRVLVATDFSDPALPALTTAAGISRRLGAHLVVMHCLDLPMAWVDPLMAAAPPFEGWPEMARLARERAAHARLRAAMDSTGAEGQTRVVFGAPAREIVSVAAELQAQMVVVGTVGRTGFRRLLLGNTAEAVVRAAPCAVLVERLHRPGYQVVAAKSAPESVACSAAKS